MGPKLRTTSFLVDGKLLLDAGTGVADLPKLEMGEVRDIVLSHAHLDHVVGAAFLCDNTYDLHGPGITIHTTEAAQQVLRDHLFNWHLWPDFSQLPSPEEPVLRFETVEPGQTKRLHGVNVTPVVVAHTVPTVGYIVERDGRVLVFSGDTATNDTLWDALNALPAVHKLIVYVSFPSHDVERATASKHYTVASLAADLPKLKHDVELLISHNKPGCEDEIRAEAPKLLADQNYRFLERGEVIDV